jgi:hypothetical protein
MTAFPDWLARVLADGESVQTVPPELAPGERPAALARLREAFDDLALDLAGPPIPFDPDAALGAAIVLARACWRLVGGDRDGRLDVGSEPTSPSVHLSADVTLRLLPSVYRRALTRDGPLAEELAAVLRRWPLSGVLADLDGGPVTPPEFGGHPGLQLLYAERLAATGRPGWVPAAGPAREWAERVYHERGRPVPVPPRTEEQTGD